MKKTILFTFIISLFLIGCHSSNQSVTNGLILLDANKDDGVAKLKLSDIADITYIPLEFGPEQILWGSYLRVRGLFVFDDKFLLVDSDPLSLKIVVYDFSGQPLFTIGSSGRGKGEYLDLGGTLVDTLANEVIIYDRMQSKFVVYSTTGQFKREKFLNDNGQALFYSCIENMNDRYMLAYHNNTQYIRENRLISHGKTFTLYDKQTLSEVEFINFEYEKPGRWPDFTAILYGLTTTKDGVYITNIRCDTIYFMDKELRLTPKFVDITHRYKDFGAQLFPAAETDKYVFFSTELETNENNLNLIKFFAYEKSTNKLLRIQNNLPERLVVERGNRSSIETINPNRGPLVTRHEDMVINDKIALGEYTMTLNHNYASLMLQPEFLLDHSQNLPKDLKVIIQDVTTSSNPVLMLIKFK